MMELIEHHIIQKPKVQTMIYAFMVMLSMDMQTLKENRSMHAISLKESTYHWLLALYDQLEMWTEYI